MKNLIKVGIVGLVLSLALAVPVAAGPLPRPDPRKAEELSLTGISDPPEPGERGRDSRGLGTCLMTVERLRQRFPDMSDDSWVCVGGVVLVMSGGRELACHEAVGGSGTVNCRPRWGRN